MEKKAPENASYQGTKTVKNIAELIAHLHSVLQSYLDFDHVPLLAVPRSKQADLIVGHVDTLRLRLGVDLPRNGDVWERTMS